MSATTKPKVDKKMWWAEELNQYPMLVTDIHYARGMLGLKRAIIPLERYSELTPTGTICANLGSGTVVDKP